MDIIESNKQATEYLNRGKIGIIPTDTIYGISCLASSKENVEKIYEIKGRDYSKPFIVLISSIKDLKGFSLSLSKKEFNILNKRWPGPISIILGVNDDRFYYLHRGKMSLAFRLPDDKNLVSLLEQTGPLVSTSANLSDHPPIKSVEEAVKHFDDKLDFMLNTGVLPDRKPSRIIEIKNGVENIIR